MLSDMPRLLVIGSGDPSFRGYILKSLHANKFKIILVTEAPVTWEEKYIETSILVNFNNEEECLSKIKKLHLNSPVNGIFTYIESYVCRTSFLSEKLDLQFYNMDSALMARDKFKMRTALHDIGLKVPKFVKCTTNIAEGALKIGFPCVLKPISGYSSINVIKLENIKDCLFFQNKINSDNIYDKWGITPEYILEEYIQGSEYSIESFISNNEIFHIGVTDKFKGPEPFFEEIGHSVPALISDELRTELLKIAGTGIAALKLNNCAVHTELKVNQRGPIIIEIGGRLAGDKIPYLWNQSINVDMSLLTAKSALTEKIYYNENLTGFSTIFFFVPKFNQKVTKVPNGSPPVEGIVEFEFWPSVGDNLLVAPEKFFSRAGFIILKNKTRDLNRIAIEKTLSWIQEQTDLSFLNITYNNETVVEKAGYL